MSPSSTAHVRSSPRPLVVHVVSHTHWDREWYHPAGRFRQRLVELVDELLDHPSPPGSSFLLDGQAIVLEDYLAVRPERRDALAAALRAEEIEAGPWFVLADELIPSGEALVRNLLAGRAVLRQLGAEPPPVLYCPDSFGHPAALPAIAAGFGFELIVLWRGLGGPAWPPGDAFLWSAPSDATVLVHHLPPDGYEFGSSLPTTVDAARARWHRVHEVLAPRATLGITLLPHGADHHARQPGSVVALAALALAGAPDRVIPSSLRRFSAELLATSAAAQGDGSIPRIRGELRESYGYTWTLQGTFGARAALKRRDRLVERLLVRDVEPWAALARRRGAPSRAPLLRAAWKALLRCHPHDTLCGCSIDEVARAMRARLDDARAQAWGLREDAILALVGHDRVAARSRPHDGPGAALVRNRAPRARGGVAELDVATLVRHVPVGPGSAARAPAAEAPAAPIRLGGAPFQVIETYERHDRAESPVHYPDDDLVRVTRVAAWVSAVPGYGILALPVAAAGVAASPDDTVRAEGRAIANRALRVAVDERGAVRLTDLVTGRTIPSLVRFEDVGDVGDLYTFSAQGPAIDDAELLGARVVHAGPLRGELRAAWRLRIPARTRRGARARRTVWVPVEAAFVLDAGAPFVRVRVRGENRARDHRLRILLATGVSDADVWADAAFAVVRRVPIRARGDTAEIPPPTAPLARYVTLAGPTHGASVYADGLAEYEALPDGAVAVTLLRAVGELSRDDLPERPGHAGWPCPTPQAQSLGPFAASFAVLPHGPRDAATIALIERTADDVLLPLRGGTLRTAGALAGPVAGLELEGDGLAFAAARESEDGEWLVLRCVNLLDEPVRGAWRLDVAPREARRARLDETPGDALPVAGDRVPVIVEPRAIATVLVR